MFGSLTPLELFNWTAEKQWTCDTLREKLEIHFGCDLGILSETLGHFEGYFEILWDTLRDLGIL